MDRSFLSPVSPSESPWRELAGISIYLTGGTGFFGCNIVKAYTMAWDRYQLGGRIFVLTRDPEQFRRKAPSLARHPAVHLLEGDLRQSSPAPVHCDYVIHAALENCEPLSFMEYNLRAMENLLNFMQCCGARRVLFTSSGAVYGPQPPGHFHLEEEYVGASPLAVASIYSETKRASELVGLVRGERHGFDFLIARCFSFLGPWLPLEGNFAAGNFIGDALAGRPIQVKGDGRPYRSYLHGEDLAKWLWTILLRGVHGRPYNVGSGEAISIADLACRVRDLLVPGAEVRIIEAPEQGPPPRYIPSVERVRLELGLTPRLGLDQAILRTAQWNRERISSTRWLF